MKKINVNISTKNIALFFGFIILIWLVYLSKEILLFLFASFIIASALMPIVDWLDKRMPRGAAVALVLISFLIIAGLIIIPSTMILSKEINEFVKTFPTYSSDIENNLAKWKSALDFLPNKANLLTTSTQLSESILNKSINFTINIFSMIIAAFTLVTIVLFILLDKHSVKRGFLSFFPSRLREQAKFIAETISIKVGGYVRGQLLVLIGVGIVTGIAMTLLKIPFAFLLGLLAAGLEIVPVIGPVLAAVPAILLAFAIKPWLALVVALTYFLIHRVENLIVPFIFGRVLNMPPLVIIIVLLISGRTLGLPGIVLAPAIAAAGFVLVHELYLKNINGEINNEKR